MTALRIIAPASPEPVDIYASWRAEIAARDWRNVHIRGDRRQPVMLEDQRRRVWR